ncbi:hypothetical protein ACFL54_04690 [Planctomycetota bacterium]
MSDLQKVFVTCAIMSLAIFSLLAAQEVDEEEVILQRAISLLDEGNADRALPLLKDYIKNNPDKLAGYIHQAAAYKELGAQQKEMSSLDSAWDLGRRNICEHPEWGELLRKTQKRMYALDPFQKVLGDITGNYTDKLKKLLQKEIKKEHWEQASRHVREGLRLNPASEDFLEMWTQIQQAVFSDTPAQHSLALFNGRDLAGWKKIVGVWKVKRRLMLCNATGQRTEAILGLVKKTPPSCTLHFEVMKDEEAVDWTSFNIYFENNPKDKHKYSLSIYSSSTPNITLNKVKGGWNNLRQTGGRLGNGTLEPALSNEDFIEIKILFQSDSIAVFQGKKQIMAYKFKTLSPGRKFYIGARNGPCLLRSFRLETK